MCGGESFLLQMELAEGASAAAAAAACSSHCLVLSVIGMQASPTASQIGKFNSKIPFWKTQKPEIDFEMVQVEVLLVETPVAGVALLHHHLPPHLPGLQVPILHICHRSINAIYV